MFNQDHDISYVIGKGEKQVLVVDLPHKATAHFVTLSGTNIVKAERYYDAWILLVQTSRRIDEKAPKGLGCETRYKAVVVTHDGQVTLSRESNGGIGCAPIERDRLAFLVLAKPYIKQK